MLPLEALLSVYHVLPEVLVHQMALLIILDANVARTIPTKARRSACPARAAPTARIQGRLFVRTVLGVDTMGAWA